jgi:hypothetical protein
MKAREYIIKVEHPVEGVGFGPLKPEVELTLEHCRDPRNTAAAPYDQCAREHAVMTMVSPNLRQSVVDRDEAIAAYLKEHPEA